MEQPNQVSANGSRWGIWPFAGWSLLCLAVYLYKIPPHPSETFHNLFLSFQYASWNGAQLLQLWFEHFLVLLSLLAALMVLLATGKRVLDIVGLVRSNSLEVWIWSLGLGFLFWGLLAEGLAFGKLFYPSWMLGLTLTAFLYFLIRDRISFLKSCWPLVGTPVGLAWKVVIAVYSLLVLANLLAPEMSWDAITYQLVLPRDYFAAHGFYAPAGIVPAHYPSLGQMFFSWGLLSGNDSLARGFCLLAYLGTALALVGLGSRLGRPVAGWVAAALYAFFPYLDIFATRGYVDLFTGFYAVLGLSAVFIFIQETDDGIAKRFAFLGAVALGSIWGIKYNAVGYTITALVMILATHKRRRGLLAGLLIGPLFFFSPWALKNWMYVHDPVYPYLPDLFHSFDWNEFNQRAAELKFKIQGLKGILEIPSVLWGIFFSNYSGAPNEEIGLGLLVFVPLLFFVNDKRCRTLWLAVGIPFFFWVVTSHQLRLVAPVVAFFAFFLGLGYEEAGRRWASHIGILRATFLTLAWLGAYYLFQGLVVQPNPFPNFLGFHSKDQFLQQVMQPREYVALNRFLDKNLPKDAKVLIVGQQNGYYLNRVCAYDFDYTRPVLKDWVEKSSTAEGLYRQFLHNDFRYLLYNSGGMLGVFVRAEELGVDRYAWKGEELKVYEQFFLKYTRKVPLPMTGVYSLYEIAPRDGFSYLPEYLPGTENYCLENIVHLMDLEKITDVFSKPIRQDVYIEACDAVTKQRPELGYPSFRLAVLLSKNPALASRALEKGKEGFARNGDLASWSAIQADVWLARNQPAKAKPFLLEAQRLSPERDDVARNLAAAYYNEHDLDKAIEQAQLAWNLAPGVEDYQKFLQQLIDLRAAAK